MRFAAGEHALGGPLIPPAIVNVFMTFVRASQT
jgi:hypothetical protein